MKKQHHNYYINSPVTEGECSTAYVDENGLMTSNLYAAEFLLYAFHYDYSHLSNDARQTAAQSLMLMAVEG